MSLTEHAHIDANAIAVGLFAGLADLGNFSNLGISKLVSALVIAFLTGAGYKLGSVVIVNLLAKFKRKP